MDTEKLEIVCYPNPVLRRAARAVEEIDDDVRAAARKMLELMYRDKGVGLAAPQVNWGVRLFVMNPTGEKKDERVLLNPLIVEKSKEKTRANEGCLSIPDVNGKIERSVAIRVEAYDLEGEEVKLDLDGFPARVCQHEIDHLDGILIIDRMGEAEKLAARSRLRDLESEYAERAAAAPHANSPRARSPRPR